MRIYTLHHSNRPFESAMPKPSKKEVKEVIDDPALEEYGDGAYWGLVHERLGLEYGDVFDIITADPEYFGYSQKQS